MIGGPFGLDAGDSRVSERFLRGCEPLCVGRAGGGRIDLDSDDDGERVSAADADDGPFAGAGGGLANECEDGGAAACGVTSERGGVDAEERWGEEIAAVGEGEVGAVGGLDGALVSGVERGLADPAARLLKRHADAGHAVEVVGGAGAGESAGADAVALEIVGSAECIGCARHEVVETAWNLERGRCHG